MYFTLKKSKITGWWVSKESSKLTFVNICDKEQLTDDFVVVGFMKDSYPELARSTNHVVKVTKKGVITAQGSFYPFEEAHALYINFLNNANTTNVVIAFNWKLKRHIMTADILREGKVTANVTFDFDPYHHNINDIGYSEKLKSDVVVSAFSRRNVCMKLGIPDEVKRDIQTNADFAYESEKIQYIDRVRSFVK